MKELLREKGFWASVVISSIGILAGIPFYQIKLPLTAGSFVTSYQTALCSQIFLFLIPVVSVLPMGAVFVREASSGFLKLYITRTSRMEYIKKKIFQIYAGGFLTFLFAGLIIFLVCFLFLYPLEQKGDIPLEAIKISLKILLRISVIGGIMSGISGIFAAVFQNFYMAYGLPFVCFYMLIILKERYFTDMYAMYPVEWIKCEKDWGTNGNGIWIFLIVCSAAVLLSNSIILSHRLQEI